MSDVTPLAVAGRNALGYLDTRASVLVEARNRGDTFAARNTPLTARGYPREGEFWRPKPSVALGAAFGDTPDPHAPHLVEQVGVTTIWVRPPKGERIALPLNAVWVDWECVTTTTPPQREYNRHETQRGTPS